MKTELVTIPSGSWQLHGVVHHPRENSARRAGVLILQESHNTKFGTHRVFLQLAQALSQAGFYVLRFDNRGTCDSPGVCDLTFVDRLADARAVLPFFRERYQLDTVVLWGLCIGGALAVHLSQELGGKGIDGMVLCSILADPSDASLPQFGYSKPDISHFVRESFRRGAWLRKLKRVVRNFSVYHKNLTKMGAIWMRRYLSPEPELDRLRRAVRQVGPLLAHQELPCLLIFGEKDTYLSHFLETVNPNDHLGLARKHFPPRMEIVPDGDHTFASREQTAELLRLTLDWLEPFQRGLAPSRANPYPGVEHGISLAPTAD